MEKSGYGRFLLSLSNSSQHIIQDWFEQKSWEPFKFQKDTWRAYRQGKHGLLNAPTGSGKTYALFMAILMEYLKEYPDSYQEPRKNGLRAIWITPIRALAKEIQQASQKVCDDLGIPWTIGVRHGDTPTSERQKQKRNMPEVLITTPESLHLLLAQKGYPTLFNNLRSIVIDEWHELMGTKRGVQVELGLSRLKSVSSKLRIWGISATIGNMDEALEALLGDTVMEENHIMVKASIRKKIEVVSILPDEIEKFPWGGHLGIKLLEKVIPIIEENSSTLIFTNTRSQAEIWYQKILDAAPELSGIIAMHHGSISKKLRLWVEEALYDERLKAVVCTSSLDLGVDFRPVEAIIQIGSPRGVARFVQRAGRSGHRPGATSRIYFLPTHALELVEAAALRQAIKESRLEVRKPYIRSFDVLVQYLITLAVSEGFHPMETYHEVKSTFAYREINEDEFAWVLNFIRNGGESLGAYDEYKKVEVEDGVYKVTSRKVAMRHRLSIGTIVADTMLKVKYMKGSYIGSIEEWFIAKMRPGDTFWFAGRNLELVRIKEMVAYVKKSTKQKGMFPSWQGGRMNLSSKLSETLREKLEELALGNPKDIELKKIKPLVQEQMRISRVPKENELLIEQFETKEGYHTVIYPFEGRNVHEGIASLMGYRISLLSPISFNIAFNDYGFELLSEKPIDLQEVLDNNLFTTDHLFEDIQASINATEMASRKFRDIASIAGLVFKGFPGKPKQDRHIQASSTLFFKVFSDYDKDNLLLKQSYDEALEFQIEEDRLRLAMNRINTQEFIIVQAPHPTPLLLPHFGRSLP